MYLDLFNGKSNSEFMDQKLNTTSKGFFWHIYVNILNEYYTILDIKFILVFLYLRIFVELS